MIPVFASFKTVWQFFIKRFNRNKLTIMRAAKRNRGNNPQPCIRCDRCTPVCPAKLLPQTLLWHIQSHDINQAESIGLSSCIECRLCEQVCPSDIPLVSYYQKAKVELAVQAKEKMAADKAKQYFGEKQARLADKALCAQQKQNDIKAALERVKVSMEPDTR